MIAPGGGPRGGTRRRGPPQKVTSNTPTSGSEDGSTRAGRPTEGLKDPQTRDDVSYTEDAMARGVRSPGQR
eukprot:4865972-Pyramimonas_sp.AAC.1